MNEKKKKHKALKIAGIIIGVLLCAALVAGFALVQTMNKRVEEQNSVLQKSDDQLIGERLTIERDGQAPVEGNIYIPDAAGEPLPLMINIHGGAFIAGDADSLDTQSDRISKNNHVVVFTVDYTLLKPIDMILSSEKKIQYQIDEVCDAVQYLTDNADEYHINPDRVIIMGYSAGGHLALGATNQLIGEGFPVYAQIIGYGELGNGIERYNAIPDGRKALCNTLIVFTGTGDFVSESMREYYDLLLENSVPVSKLEFPNANHGFLEENNPEYANAEESEGRSPEQETYMHEAEAQITEWLSGLESANQ